MLQQQVDVNTAGLTAESAGYPRPLPQHWLVKPKDVVELW